MRELLSSDLKMAVMLRWIYKRISNNKNLILLINGETGSGKTYAGLTLAVECAKMLGTKFTVENNVGFNFVKLLKKMEYREGNKEPGTVFLFEEVGAVGSGGGSKQWQTKANQFFSSFAQTSRHLRQIFIMTCPGFTNLQKDTRELCHMQWEMQGINTSAKLSYVKPRRIQVNRTSGKMYMKYLRFNHHRNNFALKRLDIRLPPPDITEDYEKAKHEFTTALNRSIIEANEPKRKELTQIQRETWEMMQKGRTMEEMCMIRSVSTGSIYDTINQLKNKGYSLEK